MKKTILLIFLVAISLRIFAVPASINDATDVAEFYLEMYHDSLDVDAVVEFKDDKKTTVAYIANLSPLGFIALSVNTDIQPIISYSVQNDFDYDSDPENILYHMLLNDMIERIDAMNNGTLPDVLIKNDLWEYYTTQDTTYFNQREWQYWPPNNSTSTGGWIETEWHQGGIYDDFCPIDPATSNRSMAGCVAIAISQILNYHEYIGNRVWTTGNDGYISMDGEPSEVYIDQEAGPDNNFPRFSSIQGNFSPLNTYLDDLRYTYNSINPTPTDDEIAALCYTSGVAYEMNYSSGASWNYNPDYTDLLIDKFNYYTADYIPNLPSLYLANLMSNMKTAQPAIVNIHHGNVGHAVVCDGYKINDEDVDYFHINFGWGGASSTWYDLPELYGSWTMYNSPIYNISPPGCHGLLSGTVSLDSGDGQITDVTITAGNKTTHPDATGYYEIELYNGEYEVSAYLFGYDESITGVEITANQNTDNIDFDLDVSAPNYIYIPTHYSSIQDGIDAAVDGDIIIVLEGEYFENINFNGKKIIVASFYYVSNNEAYIDNTIINGNNNGRVVTFMSGEDFNSSLIGFTITGGSLGGVRCEFSSPTLKKLKITENEASVGAGLHIYSSDMIVQDVEVFDNLNTTSNNGAGAVYCSGYNIILKNVSVYDNNQIGISMSRIGADLILENVSVCDNGWSGDGYVGIYHLAGDITMNNCLVWGNNNDEDQIFHSQSYGGILTVTYSDIQGGWTGTGNINEGPLVDANYKPLWTEADYSPLIDTGDPSIFDPDGTISDIGAVRAIDHKNETIELLDSTINWMCFPVINTTSLDADLAENWLDDIWDNTVLDEVEWIRNGTGQSIVWDEGEEEFTNPLHEFTSAQGYKVSMLQSFDLDVTGFLESQFTAIDLTAGMLPEGRINWIGYFPEVSMKPLDAFEAVLDDIDMIQTKDFTLTKTALGWLGASNWTLNYGDLVVVNCTNDCSFYWGEQGGGSVPKSTRSTAEGFTYIEEADYIPVYVELDPEALGNPTEIGIFVDNECMGAEVIEDSLVQICAYVLNDSMAFDPGSVEFQLYYTARSENMVIDTYSIKENLNDVGNKRKLDFSKSQDRYYLISLKDSGNNTPGIIKTSLDKNYPNPFNPTTTIRYSLANDGDVELNVYNVKGQKVRTLVNENKNSGHYQAIWDGTDNSKKQVASGVYFYRLTTSEKTLNKKMLLLK
ncbi:MAG: C10 family peptidase [Candidatus Tenebribacter mawsonii]|nr:C10 family peptidase [Candidatus Tenebribacter mawsonii]